ncbi:hypothetical protein ACFL0M_13980 [Thermodesulfobacteriota bacterium]
MRQTFGWRAVIGCIRPSHGMVSDVQLKKAAPEGVAFNSATMLGRWSWRSWRSCWSYTRSNPQNKQTTN